MNNQSNPVISRLLHISQISRKLQVMNVPERQIVLHDIQDQIGAIRQLYLDHTVMFKSLSVAYEAIRLTWYALGADEDGCREKLEYLDAAVQRLAEHLLKPMASEAAFCQAFDIKEEIV
jgi:hypothetical protein